MASTTVAKRNEVTDRIFKDIVTREKAAENAKTARLKALRLARDADEAAAAEAAPPPALKKPAAKKAVKRRSVS
jgi:hypothetical protein